jgi:hypothetical protein
VLKVIEEILPVVVIMVMVRAEEEILGEVTILVVVEVTRVDPLLEEGMKQIRDGNMIQAAAVEVEGVAMVVAQLVEVLAGDLEVPMEEAVVLMEVVGVEVDTVMGRRQTTSDFTEMNAQTED